MQPNNSGPQRPGGPNFPGAPAHFAYPTETRGFGEGGGQRHFPGQMGGMQGGPPGQGWGNMMGQYPAMNPMFRGGGIYSPYGYIPPVGPQNYKTKKCRHYETGRCKLAGLCNFAHGDEELRSASDK